MSDISKRIAGLTTGEKRDLLTRLLARKAMSTDVPLSYAQQRLWFLDQIAPASASYNMPIALRLRMPLDVPALIRTLNEIVRRHEVLRTTFSTRDGQPVQVIAAQISLAVRENDLQHLSDANREEEVQRLATAESRRPFDLTRGPLIRAGLLRLGVQDHVLLLTLHHIIADGWSLRVLFRELSTLYAAFAAGRPSPLPDLPIQFADYASWQRRWLEGPVLQEQLAYWRRQLDGLPELILPTDRPRPATATFRGARRFFTIAEDALRPIESITRQTGTTPFMVLLAVFEVLLYRYSGQEDFPIGVPIANRTRNETEGLIGFFVNTVVLRADLSHDPTFRELLARVRETALSAYEHQDLPFDRLVEELHPARDAARIPLIQAMFALQNAPGDSAGLNEPPIEMVEVDRGTANFDLVLDLWEQERALGGRIEFSTDLFDPDTIERLLIHFRTLLAAVAVDTNQRVSALPLMPVPERQRVLAEWNATESEYPADLPLSTLFEAQALATPHSTALWFDGESLTYGEMNARANQIAHCLRATGVGAGDLVAVQLERSAGLILALLGILKAGGAYVPLDVSYPQARLAAMMGDAHPRALITTRALASSLPETDAAVVLLDEHAAIRVASIDNLPSTRTGEDPAYVMYTSGSTGMPKGIVIPHRAVNRLVRNTNYIEIGPADRIAQASNVSFDASTFEIWGALLNGAQLVGVPKEVLLSPTELPAYLRDHRITTLFVTTALFNQIARTRPDAFRGLKHLLFGGERAEARWVREVLAHGAPERLLHVYGPTECTTFATWHLIHRVDPGATAVAIGRPVANTTAYVLDPHGQPVPVGVAGELHLGGPGLALGYLGRPELTAGSFFSSSFGRLYRTGDSVRIRADYALEFVGRRDTQVKIRGHRVELREIESILMRHPAVCDVAVVARDGNAGDKGLAAYVVLDQPSPIGAGSAADDWVREWQRVYDEVIYDNVHDHPIARQDPLFNVAGWTSSYTGQPISPEEMREQVDQTVEQILALAPAEVLEIGCGTGLLLFRIAPSALRYAATDFSRPALDYVGRQLALRAEWPVELLERRADDFSGLEDERFDLVILNSVIQYFPHADYLLRILKSAASVLKPGGTIFVGDVRSLPLLEAFHTAVELHQVPGSLPIDDLRARVRRRVAEERELVVAPQFFLAVRDELPQITDVTIQPKRGRRHNELTRFRYDVHLRTAPSVVAGSPPAVRDWCGNELSVPKLRHELLTSGPDFLCIERVPNARTAHEVEALRRLDDLGCATAGELRLALDRTALAGVDPEDLWAMSDDVPYTVGISWAGGWPDGAYNVVFRRAGTARLATDPPSRAMWNRSSALTNQPHHAASGHPLIPQLRTLLQGQLPDYMVPAAFVVLEKLPLTPNGKVDVRALPAPDADRPALGGSYVAPRTALERVLAGHWASVLGLERVGVTDSFFDLGGHSLVATQLVARIQATLRVQLTLRTLFSKPTVADLGAALLAEAGSGQRLERVASLVLAVAEMPEDEAAMLLAERTMTASPSFSA
jgi:amino acid adenylation domain-containing protein